MVVMVAAKKWQKPTGARDIYGQGRRLKETSVRPGPW